jgi:2-oxoisovalerate dehydrogenase E2 component (dihydrolipoyl transacylase)
MCLISLETRQRRWFPKGVPLINHRKAAILGMGSLKPWPVVVDDDRRPPAGTLPCAFDHRIANGAKVAQLLGELRQLVGSPEKALLDL